MRELCFVKLFFEIKLENVLLQLKIGPIIVAAHSSRFPKLLAAMAEVVPVLAVVAVMVVDHKSCCFLFDYPLYCCRCYWWCSSAVVLDTKSHGNQCSVHRCFVILYRSVCHKIMVLLFRNGNSGYPWLEYFDRLETLGYRCFLDLHASLKTLTFCFTLKYTVSNTRYTQNLIEQKFFTTTLSRRFTFQGIGRTFFSEIISKLCCIDVSFFACSYIHTQMEYNVFNENVFVESFHGRN